MCASVLTFLSLCLTVRVAAPKHFHKDAYLLQSAWPYKHADEEMEKGSKKKEAENDTRLSIPCLQNSLFYLFLVFPVAWKLVQRDFLFDSLSLPSSFFIDIYGKKQKQNKKPNQPRHALKKKKNSFFLIYKHDRCHFSPFIDHFPKNFVHEKKKREYLCPVSEKEKRTCNVGCGILLPLHLQERYFFFFPLLCRVSDGGHRLIGNSVVLHFCVSSSVAGKKKKKKHIYIGCLTNKRKKRNA